MSREIVITESDKKKLEKIISDLRHNKSDEKNHVVELESELKNASVVSSEMIPKDIVTMNSKIMLSFEDYEEDEEEVIYTLVYPHEADHSNNRISILAPIGTAILGYKEGDTIDWKVPGGVTKINIKKVFYQPEASGNFDL